MKVMKFGGTSVQDAAAIRRLIEIVKRTRGRKLVVVSALAKVTDALVSITNDLRLGRLKEAQKALESLKVRHLELSHDLGVADSTETHITTLFSELTKLTEALSAIQEISPRSQDRILASGELLSSKIVNEAFNRSGIAAHFVDARQVLKTEAVPLAAPVDFEATRKQSQTKLSPLITDTSIAVLGGFIGSDPLGMTTTLGRGGSDYSAAVLGSVLDAEAIEIWTDVDGILTTDPRIVPEAKRIRKLSFDEAAELAYFGAKVLHPATLLPAVQKGIPVWVLNSQNPDNTSGTLITAESQTDSNVVKAITCKRKITLINIHSTRMLGAAGFLKSVFDLFAECGVSIDSISTSEVNVSMTLDGHVEPERLKTLQDKLSRFSMVSIHYDRASVAIVGKGIREAAGVGARIFGALKGINVSMISMGSSEVNLNLVVENSVVDDVLRKLHHEFFSGSLNPEIFAAVSSLT